MFSANFAQLQGKCSIALIALVDWIPDVVYMGALSVGESENGSPLIPSWKMCGVSTKNIFDVYCAHFIMFYLIIYETPNVLCNISVVKVINFYCVNKEQIQYV